MSRGPNPTAKGSRIKVRLAKLIHSPCGNTGFSNSGLCRDEHFNRAFPFLG